MCFYFEIIRHYFDKLHIFYCGDKMKIKEGMLRDNLISLKTLEVDLDNTKLLILSGYNAFAMCGALNVDIYNSPKMVSRHVVCMRAVGVRTLEDLYEAKIEDCSNYAKSIGIEPGIYIKDAFKKLSVS